jgi:radical SAM/Cys-rich protein
MHTLNQFPAIDRAALETIQANLGYRCNQACVHCHVGAGPKRMEMMDAETADWVLALLDQSSASTLDLTGGAPELNPEFRRMVAAARRCGAEVIDRCNLTVLEEPGQADLADFLADWRVHIIASLPCYLEDNVDRQRGLGTFQKSLRALRQLNGRGYGREGSGLVLDLVFNPQGAQLPPAQDVLEQVYRHELTQRFGIEFNRLRVLTNMPIRRFRDSLMSSGELSAYMQRLRDAYRAENLDRVMCRSLLSIDWRGFVYDCDFNQLAGIDFGGMGGGGVHVRELLDKELTGLPIRVAPHCFGCTAGAGSSCGGALTSSAIMPGSLGTARVVQGAAKFANPVADDGKGGNLPRADLETTYV